MPALLTRLLEKHNRLHEVVNQIQNKPMLVNHQKDTQCGHWLRGWVDENNNIVAEGVIEKPMVEYVKSGILPSVSVKMWFGTPQSVLENSDVPVVIYGRAEKRHDVNEAAFDALQRYIPRLPANDKLDVEEISIVPVPSVPNAHISTVVEASGAQNNLFQYIQHDPGVIITENNEFDSDSTLVMANTSTAPAVGAAYAVPVAQPNATTTTAGVAREVPTQAPAHAPGQAYSVPAPQQQQPQTFFPPQFYQQQFQQQQQPPVQAPPAQAPPAQTLPPQASPPARAPPTQSLPPQASPPARAPPQDPAAQQQAPDAPSAPTTTLTKPPEDYALKEVEVPKIPELTPEMSTPEMIKFREKIIHSRDALVTQLKEILNDNKRLARESAADKEVVNSFINDLFTQTKTNMLSYMDAARVESELSSFKNLSREHIPILKTMYHATSIAAMNAQKNSANSSAYNNRSGVFNAPPIQPEGVGVAASGATNPYSYHEESRKRQRDESANIIQQLHAANPHLDPGALREAYSFLNVELH